jgi:cysteine desulfurase/selenocysteine lyase
MIQSFKDSFYQNPNRIHLNNSGLAPISKPARDKILYWGNRFFEEGFYTDHDYVQDVLHSRKSLATLIGCDHSQIAFFQSTASAVSQLAMQFPLSEHDEVIMWECEYGSHLYPWQEAVKRKKAKLTLIDPESNLATPVEKIIEKISDKTKVIAISWVQFLTGARSDLKTLSKITKEKGIFLCVDIIQGLGLHEFHMQDWGADAVYGGSHKWLYSPVGVGYLALSPELLKIIKPHNVGSYTFGTCDDPTSLICEPKVDALKYEAGSKQVLEITALGASVDLILKTRVSEIEKETLRLSKKLRTQLEKNGLQIFSPYSLENHQTPIVNFLLSNASKEKSIELIKGTLESLPCNFAIRGPGVRISPAAFNTDEDIDKVANAIIRLQPK